MDDAGVEHPGTSNGLSVCERYLKEGRSGRGGGANVVVDRRGGGGGRSPLRSFWTCPPTRQGGQ
jgi:hypothetical protein